MKRAKVVKPIEYLLVGTVVLIYSLASFLCFRWTSITPEWNSRLPQFLDPCLNIFEKVFNPVSLDTGRHRELSYLFDYVDTQAVDLLFRFGYPSFPSVMHWLFVGIMSELLYFFIRTRLRESRGFGILAVAWFLSTGNFIGLYFRNAKIGAECGIVSLLLLGFVYMQSLQQKVAEPSKKVKLAIFSAAFLTMCCDEQGAFIAAMILGYLVLLALFHRRPRDLAYFLFPFISYYLFAHWISPWLTWVFGGFTFYWNFNDEFIKVSQLSGLSPWLEGMKYVADVFRFMIGRVSYPQLLVLLPLFFFFAFFKSDNKISGREWGYKLLAFSGTIIALILMATLMLVTHRTLELEVTRFFYYPLPLIGFFFFWQLWGIWKIHNKFSKPVGIWVVAAIVLLSHLELREFVVSLKDTRFSGKFEGKEILRSFDSVSGKYVLSPNRKVILPPSIRFLISDDRQCRETRMPTHKFGLYLDRIKNPIGLNRSFSWFFDPIKSNQFVLEPQRGALVHSGYQRKFDGRGLLAKPSLSINPEHFSLQVIFAPERNETLETVHLPSYMFGRDYIFGEAGREQPLDPTVLGDYIFGGAGFKVAKVPGSEDRFGFEFIKYTRKSPTLSCKISFGSWNYLAVSIENKKMRLFCGGRLIESGTLSSPMDYPRSSFVVGNGLNGWNSFRGRIREVLIENEPLSDSSVAMNWEKLGGNLLPYEEPK